MQLISADLPSDFELIFFGDTHDGTILQHRDGIQVLIDYVLAKRNRYAVHMGDWLEAIMRDDKRYDDCTIQDKPLMQCSSTVKDFTPIKKRLLCGLSGNHEFKLHRFGNLADHICRELGIPYGTYAAKIAMNDSHGLMFKAYINHGFGRLNSNAKDPEQQIANMKANLKLKLKNKAADCAIMAMGHTHKLLVVEPTRSLYLTDDGIKLKQHYKGTATNGQYIDPDERWYVNTGSFLKNSELGEISYPEVAGYDPVELGFIVSEIHDRKITSVYKRTV